MSETKQGQLRVWWVPQIPMKAFYVEVETAQQGKFLLDTLADYDIFQFENRIKPDYSNAGGLEVFEDGEWSEWCNEEGDSIDEVTFAKAEGSKSCQPVSSKSLASRKRRKRSCGSSAK